MKTLLLVLLALQGCDAPPWSEPSAAVDPGEVSARLAVVDMLAEIPPEGRDISRRFISGEWQDGGAVWPSVVEASGLPARHLTRAEVEDSATLVLNLFRPRSLGGDSLLVIAEWLIYEPGELFWGTDYQYVVRCGGPCEIATRHGPGHLN